VKQGSASTQSPASVQKDLGQIATNGHAFLVAEQQKIAQAPAFGGRMLPPQRHEARRDLADGGVRRRARQDAAFSLARQKQQQEHADGLGLARAWRAPDEAELARCVSPRRRDAARNGVGLRVVELERGQRGRHVGVYASRGAQQWRALPIKRVVSVLVGRKHKRAERGFAVCSPPGDDLDKGRILPHRSVEVEATPDAHVGYETEQTHSESVAVVGFDLLGLSDHKVEFICDIFDVGEAVRAAAARELGRPARHGIGEHDDVTDAWGTRSTTVGDGDAIVRGAFDDAHASEHQKRLYWHGGGLAWQCLQVRAHLGPYLLQQRGPERVQVAFQTEKPVRNRVRL
jgi:hypothetical protein